MIEEENNSKPQLLKTYKSRKNQESIPIQFKTTTSTILREDCLLMKKKKQQDISLNNVVVNLNDHEYYQKIIEEAVLNGTERIT